MWQLLSFVSISEEMYLDSPVFRIISYETFADVFQDCYFVLKQLQLSKQHFKFLENDLFWTENNNLHF